MGNTNLVDLHKIVQVKNFYQVTIFISDKFINFSELYLLEDYPNKIYSFNSNNEQQLLYDNTSKNALKNMYSLQESLIIFYISNSYEVKSFIGFLIPQLSIRQRPKILIIYSSNNESNEELNISYILEYTWKERFLDFTVMVKKFEKTLIDPFFVVYYLNPFEDIIYQKKLDESFEIFPEKLFNAYGYPFYIANQNAKFQNVQVTHPHRKLRIHLFNEFFLDFMMKIMNFDFVLKKVTIYRSFAFDDYLKKWNLDMLPWADYQPNYLKRFIVPLDIEPEKHYAFVPIFKYSQLVISPENFLIFFAASVVVFTLLYFFQQFRSSLKQIELFDLTKIIFGRSVSWEPKRTVYRIIYLTVVIASVKITNDFLLDLFSIQFKQKEVQFNSYKDLWDSGLQTYTTISWYKNISRFHDEYLWKIINRTLYVDDFKHCRNTLIKWKNVSCISYDILSQVLITNFRDPNGYPLMKIAKPSILSKSHHFFWFTDGSPYALKFLKILRRARETGLMHFLALLDKNKFIRHIHEDLPVKSLSEVKSEQLWIILFFGTSVSIIIFIMEFIVFTIEKKIFNHCSCQNILLSLLFH